MLLITNEGKKQIQSYMDKLTKGIKVTWDRYVVSHDETISIYGWIAHPTKRNRKDFILFQIYKDASQFYTTSSVEGSKICAKNWEIEHSNCQKWNE